MEKAGERSDRDRTRGDKDDSPPARERWRKPARQAPNEAVETPMTRFEKWPQAASPPWAARLGFRDRAARRPARSLAVGRQAGRPSINNVGSRRHSVHRHRRLSKPNWLWQGPRSSIARHDAEAGQSPWSRSRPSRETPLRACIRRRAARSRPPCPSRAPPVRTPADSLNVVRRTVMPSATETLSKPDRESRIGATPAPSAP